MKRLWASKLLPLFFLFLGMIFSLILTWKSLSWIEETERIRFKAASELTINLIEKELNAYIQLIHGVSAFMSASNDVSREEWKQYAYNNHINELFLGFRALGYAPKVHSSERTLHEKKIHSEGYPNYKVYQMNESNNSFMFPITYIEPLSEINEKAFGFDLASEKTRKEAIDHAVARADATLSSRIMLVQPYSTNYQAGFLILFPLYEYIDVPPTIEAHINNTKGVVYIAIDAKKLFEQILKSNYLLVDFEIFDSPIHMEKNSLFDSNSHLTKARYNDEVVIDLYGQRWLIHVKADEILDMSSSRYFPWVQLVFGIVLFGLVGGLIYVLQRTRDRAYAIADEKTKLLAKSESEIRSIFQTMQEGILILDDQRKIIECNLAAQEMLGLSKSEIVGQLSSDLSWTVIREDGTLYELEERPSYKVFSTGMAQYNIHMGIKHKSGSILWVKANAQPIYSDDFETIVSVLITMSDITAFHKSQYTLEKYLQIIDMHVIISSTDLHGIITDVSKAFCDISGYTRSELIGKSHNIVRHPEVKKEFYKEMWHTLKKGIPWSGEIKNLHKDGSAYWVETIIEPRYDEEHHMIGYTGIRHNITDKKRVEELSITDHLTGLYNRLKLDELFASYLSLAKRHQMPFSVVLLDIDKFKLVNDTYGHQVGDSLLQEIAILLKRNIRFEDAVGRWGGEEFLLLLPGSTLENSRLLAEKLRHMIEAKEFMHVGHRTASFGVATYHHEDDEKSMTSRADAALYRAKENGRNRVETEHYAPEFSPSQTS